MSKWKIYLMGFATLLMAPLGWLLCGMPEISSFLQLDRVFSVWTGIGIEYGVVFGIFMLIVTNTETARRSFSVQHQLIRSMKLNIFDILFLSLCAGFGEEILFRVAVQQWSINDVGETDGPTKIGGRPENFAIAFVAIHGYINPKDLDTTKYGMLVCLFILVLSFAISGEQGLWFCIAAHASYDFVLFYFWGRN